LEGVKLLVGIDSKYKEGLKIALKKKLFMKRLKFIMCQCFKYLKYELIRKGVCIVHWTNEHVCIQFSEIFKLQEIFYYVL